jgi:chromobox protein 1
VGYNEKSDLTWELEENIAYVLFPVLVRLYLLIDTCYSETDILHQYYENRGGRQSILEGGLQKGKTRLQTRKKKRRAITNRKKLDIAQITSPATRQASLAREIFTPPHGSWEDKVKDIEVRNTDGNIMVLLHWPNGYKTMHKLDEIYNRCPQKVCRND